MVYNWEGKETECYQLYVQEKKSLNEVLEYWEQRGFTPRYVIACLEIWRAIQVATFAYLLRLGSSADNNAVNVPFKRNLK